MQGRSTRRAALCGRAAVRSRAAVRGGAAVRAGAAVRMQRPGSTMRQGRRTRRGYGHISKIISIVRGGAAASRWGRGYAAAIINDIRVPSPIKQTTYAGIFHSNSKVN